MRTNLGNHTRGAHHRLLARLREAEDTLQAIRSGQVDALVINGPDEEQVFTLQGADFVYRMIVEEMGEGAASLGLDAAILYCNRRLAAMLRTPLENTIGASLRDFLPAEQHGRLDDLIRRAARVPARAEFTLIARDGGAVPAVVSVSNLAGQGIPAVSAVFTDLSVEKENFMRLATANDELEAFNYSVSHDLRTPLRAIAGYTQALAAEGGSLNERGKEYCSRIVLAVLRMSAIIDAMLYLSRTTLAHFATTTVDMSALAREIADELRKAEPQRRVVFSIAPSLKAAGDRELLRQALQNLIGNAWKFTAGVNGARIEFASLNKDGRAVFFVRDNGVGFESAFSDKLFQPFQRLQPRDAYPGTGIGLAVTQRIIRRHKGRIWAESHAGMGATFYFELPSENAPAP